MSGSDHIHDAGQGPVGDDGLDFIDAAFDAELASLFEAAGPSEHDPAFTARVLSEAGRTSRVRILALSGAGTAGSVIAATQLDRLVDLSSRVLGGELGGVLGQAAQYVGPEAVVMVAFAGIALAFARVLPGGRLA